MSSLGSPAAVASAADDLLRAAGVVEHAHDVVNAAKPRVWQGEAADAYSAAAGRSLTEATALADLLRAGSGTLSRYAAAQGEAARALSSAQTSFDRAQRAVRANPLDLAALADGWRAHWDAMSAVGRQQQAAAIAARELRDAIGLDADARPWWDPFGWFNDPEDPDERVSDNILDDDSFDPDDVSQGQIGDCFMLSVVVSLLETDAGDDFIRDNIRWDDAKQGYWVTLYSNGTPKEVFVEYVFGNGAKQDDWQWWIFGGDKPSIAALYESAIRQEYGYHAIDGGVPADAMEMITGQSAWVVENNNYAGLSDGQVESLRDAMTDGAQVVISSPRSGDHQITVTAPDGSTREIDVVNTHAYSVTRIDADGSVWMRNPWGPGNSADGGGEFRVSADDVADLFWRASVVNVTD